MRCEQECGRGWCACVRLRSLGVQVVEADIAERGWYDAERRTVVVRRGLSRPARRSTLAHELVHVEAGDALRPGWWSKVHEPVIEARADELASRNLIPLGSLIHVLVEALDEDEAADMLEVDVDMVRARLRSLTDAERWHLEQVTRPRRPA